MSHDVCSGQIIRKTQLYRVDSETRVGFGGKESKWTV